MSDEHTTLFHPWWDIDTETLRVVICDGCGHHLIVSEPFGSMEEAANSCRVLNEIAERAFSKVIQAAIEKALRETFSQLTRNN